MNEEDINLYPVTEIDDEENNSTDNSSDVIEVNPEVNPEVNQVDSNLKTNTNEIGNNIQNVSLLEEIRNNTSRNIELERAQMLGNVCIFLVTFIFICYILVYKLSKSIVNLFTRYLN